MSPKKYEHLVITRPPKTDGLFGSEFEFRGDTDYKSDFSMFFIQVREPCLMEKDPHVHDFDMCVYFLAPDGNMDDLGGEIEFGFGDGPDKEIYTFTKATSIFIPKGVVHCPLNFKKVTKPIIFVHLTLAEKYFKKA